MAAPKGNHNAIGNSGGKEWGKENRNKAAKVKGKALDLILKALNGKDENFKKQILLKIAPSCLPQEVTGEGGQPIKIFFDKSFKNDPS